MFFTIVFHALSIGVEEDVRALLGPIKWRATLNAKGELESMNISKAAKKVC